MLTGFSHDVAAGNGNLIVLALKSPNYVAGSSGWRIGRDGSSEFNNVTVRGTLIVKGTSGGVLVYDRNGNLIAQVSGDNLGYPYGIISWNGTLSFVGLSSDQVVWNQNASSPNSQWRAGLGAANNLIFTGPPLFPNSVVQMPGLAVQGATTTAGQLAFVKQTGTPNDHAMTVFLNVGSAGGTSQAALNVVSDNPNFSCLEVTGTETGRGTVKIAHQGQANASDANSSAISIDLQTTVGGVTGTAAKGIFITSTTDVIPAGDAITIRFNSQDWFVVKGNVAAGFGIVGIGVATGHLPSGMLEIAQKDTTTPGLTMTAIAAGTDMISLKDSGGTLRWQVNNAGNMSVRANAFFNSPVIFGSLSSDSGGGGGGTVTFAHNTDPTTNPAAGHVILYCDALGNLLARTQAGNIRTVAAV